MNTVTVNNASENCKMSPLMKMISKDAVGIEQRYDFDVSNRMNQLEKEIKARDGAEKSIDLDGKFSSEFIIRQALERYFELLNEAIQSLDSIFTTCDMEIIINVNCSPFCQWNANKSVAGMVVDDHGIEQLSDLADDSDTRLLLEKLMHLSPTQNAALIDVCERFWRSAKGNSLEETFAEMNFILA